MIDESFIGRDSYKQAPLSSPRSRKDRRTGTDAAQFSCTLRPVTRHDRISVQDKANSVSEFPNAPPKLPPPPRLITQQANPPIQNTQTFTSVPAAVLPGAGLSGRLTGVVSLTDILNLFARSSGLSPSDPSEQRARRRCRGASCWNDNSRPGRRAVSSSKTTRTAG